MSNLKTEPTFAEPLLKCSHPERHPLIPCSCRYCCCYSKDLPANYRSCLLCYGLYWRLILLATRNSGDSDHHLATDSCCFYHAACGGIGVDVLHSKPSVVVH